MVIERASAQESSRDLLEPFVFRLLGLNENLLNVRLESGLAPVTSSCALGELRFVHARRFQQGTRRRQVEPGIAGLREIVVPPRHLAFGVVPQKGL
jgi:hypothetical protein